MTTVGFVGALLGGEATMARRANRPGQPDGLPYLVRFLGMHAGFGAALGIGVAGLLLWLDVAGIGTLFVGERAQVAITLLFFGSFALTFASVAMGTAVMLLPKSDDEFPRG